MDQGISVPASKRPAYTDHKLATHNREPKTNFRCSLIMFVFFFLHWMQPTNDLDLLLGTNWEAFTC